MGWVGIGITIFCNLLFLQFLGVGRTVFVQFDTQIVCLILACMTSGFVAPGVRVWSGRSLAQVTLIPKKRKYAQNPYNKGFLLMSYSSLLFPSGSLVQGNQCRSAG
jgi:hypothetical protein